MKAGTIALVAGNEYAQNMPEQLFLQHRDTELILSKHKLFEENARGFQNKSLTGGFLTIHWRFGEYPVSTGRNRYSLKLNQKVKSI